METYKLTYRLFHMNVALRHELIVHATNLINK